MSEPEQADRGSHDNIADLLRQVLEAEQADRDAAGGPGWEDVAVSTALKAAEAAGFITPEVPQEIGRGAMGIVFKAQEKTTGRTVAVKILSPRIAQDPAAGKRFREEALMAKSLEHPNIVSVLHIDEKDPPRFFVMEFIEGPSLAERISDARFLSPEQAASITIQLCDALRLIHHKGFAHRDIKPSNIMLEGDVQRPKITDFGIAQGTADLAPKELSGGETGLGTPSYMAPEQELVGFCDARTDIYSLGVTFYRMLTGRLPGLPDKDHLAFLFKGGTACPPSQRNPLVSEELDAVVLRMIAINPQDRFQNCAEVIRRLQLLQTQSRLSIAPRMRSSLRMRATIALSLLLLVVAVISGWYWAWHLAPPPAVPSPPQTAVDQLGVPFRAVVEGSIVKVLDRFDKVLYNISVRGRPIEKPALVELRAGQPQHLVVGVQGPGQDTGKVMVYDHKGELAWEAPTFSGDEPCPYPGAASNRMTISDLVVADLWQDGELCIVTTSNDLDSYQTKITVFNSHGTRKATYWHPGQFQKISVFKPSHGSRMRILAWGINNDMARARPESSGRGYYWGIACLDPETMSGEAPPRRGLFRQGSELWYALILPQGTDVQDVRVRPPTPGASEGLPGQLLQVYTRKNVFMFLDENGKLMRRMVTDAGTGDESVTSELIR